jgi:hypothetical protein
MPAERRLPTRRLRNSASHSGPVTRSAIQRDRTLGPPPLPEDVFHPGPTTPVVAGSREVSTEPSTPSSPTLGTRGYRRALQRQRSAYFVQAVLQYDRAENDLQPWFW